MPTDIAAQPAILNPAAGPKDNGQGTYLEAVVEVVLTEVGVEDID